VPWAKLALLGRALERVRRELDGALTVVHLRRSDYADTGADESETEGIIDHVRTVAGTTVAAVARELPGTDDDVRTKVSLRAADGTIDVSAIARAGGGGGHPQAAGFTTTMGEDELVRFLAEQLLAHR
jgi:phosphoesterase RecJ-like protein